MSQPSSRNNKHPTNNSGSYGKLSSLNPRTGSGRNGSYGGMLVLGRSSVGSHSQRVAKVSVPKPINLPSLKKEYAGNDPRVSLVNSSSQGWTKSQEKEEKVEHSRPSYSNSNGHLEDGPGLPVADTASSQNQDSMKLKSHLYSLPSWQSSSNVNEKVVGKIVTPASGEEFPTLEASFRNTSSFKEASLKKDLGKRFEESGLKNPTIKNGDFPERQLASRRLNAEEEKSFHSRVSSKPGFYQNEKKSLADSEVTWRQRAGNGLSSTSSRHPYGEDQTSSSNWTDDERAPLSITSTSKPSVGRKESDREPGMRRGERGNGGYSGRGPVAAGRIKSTDLDLFNIKETLSSPWSRSQSVGIEPPPSTVSLETRLARRKKEEQAEAESRDLEREKFEEELEMVRKQKELEKQRRMEEEQRMIHAMRREQEAKVRQARVEVERRLAAEREAKEARERATKEAEEASRKAEEERKLFLEEKKRLAEEEEKRKENARKKLQELEERIAKREAEEKAKLQKRGAENIVLKVKPWEEDDRASFRSNLAASASSQPRGWKSLSQTSALPGFTPGFEYPPLGVDKEVWIVKSNLFRKPLEPKESDVASATEVAEEEQIDSGETTGDHGKGYNQPFQFESTADYVIGATGISSREERDQVTKDSYSLGKLTNDSGHFVSVGGQTQEVYSDKWKSNADDAWDDPGGQATELAEESSNPVFSDLGRTDFNQASSSADIQDNLSKHYVSGTGRIEPEASLQSDSRLEEKRGDSIMIGSFELPLQLDYDVQFGKLDALGQMNSFPLTTPIPSTSSYSTLGFEEEDAPESVSNRREDIGEESKVGPWGRPFSEYLDNDNESSQSGSHLETGESRRGSSKADQGSTDSSPNSREFGVVGDTSCRESTKNLSVKGKNSGIKGRSKVAGGKGRGIGLELGSSSGKQPQKRTVPRKGDVWSKESNADNLHGFRQMPQPSDQPPLLPTPNRPPLVPFGLGRGRRLAVFSGESSGKMHREQEGKREDLQSSSEKNQEIREDIASFSSKELGNVAFSQVKPNESDQTENSGNQRSSPFQRLPVFSSKSEVSLSSKVGTSSVASMTDAPSTALGSLNAEFSPQRNVESNSNVPHSTTDSLKPLVIQPQATILDASVRGETSLVLNSENNEPSSISPHLGPIMSPSHLRFVEGPQTLPLSSPKTVTSTPRVPDVSQYSPMAKHSDSTILEVDGPLPSVFPEDTVINSPGTLLPSEEDVFPRLSNLGPSTSAPLREDHSLSNDISLEAPSTIRPSSQPHPQSRSPHPHNPPQFRSFQVGGMLSGPQSFPHAQENSPWGPPHSLIPPPPPHFSEPFLNPGMPPEMLYGPPPPEPFGPPPFGMGYGQMDWKRGSGGLPGEWGNPNSIGDNMGGHPGGFGPRPPISPFGGRGGPGPFENPLMNNPFPFPNRGMGPPVPPHHQWGQPPPHAPMPPQHLPPYPQGPLSHPLMENIEESLGGPPMDPSLHGPGFPHPGGPFPEGFGLGEPFLPPGGPMGMPPPWASPGRHPFGGRGFGPNRRNQRQGKVGEGLGNGPVGSLNHVVGSGRGNFNGWAPSGPFRNERGGPHRGADSQEFIAVEENGSWGVGGVEVGDEEVGGTAETGPLGGSMLRSQQEGMVGFAGGTTEGKESADNTQDTS